MEVPNENINLNNWKDYIFIITSSVMDTNTNTNISSILFDVNAIIAGNEDYYEMIILKDVYVKYGDSSDDIKTDVSIYTNLSNIESIKFKFNFYGIVSDMDSRILSIKAIKIK